MITSPDTPHICYCHTPTRYLWSDTHQYLNELKYNKWIKKIISIVLNRLRIWDRLAADRVDYFIANSKTVEKRITKYYRRESSVIYPPVETEKFAITDISQQADEEKYFLIGCRLAPYKRVDIVVEAFRDLLPDMNLKIFGDGVDIKRLKKLAGDAKNIQFLGRVSEHEKASLYSSSQAFINPQEEDFGITVVEAMAAGRPVIAYKKGGATETVLDGKTGLFFESQDKEAIAQAVHEFTKHEFNSAEIKAWSENYSCNKFKQQIREFIIKNTGKDIAI